MTDRQPPTRSVGLRLSVSNAQAAQGLLSVRKIRVQTREFPAQASITDGCSSARRKGQATHVHDGRVNCSVDAAKPDGLAWKPTRHHAGTPSRIGTVLSHPTALQLTRSHALWLDLGKAQCWRHARSARHELTSLRQTTAVRRMRRLRSFAWKQSPSFSVHCCPLLSGAVRCCVRHDEPHGLLQSTNGGSSVLATSSNRKQRCPGSPGAPAPSLQPPIFPDTQTPQRCTALSESSPPPPR